MPIDAKQYDSAIEFIDDEAKFTKLLSNVSNNDDRMRLKAYELYEDMYHNRPEHMRIILRGGDPNDPDCEDDDSIEIYIPSAKKNIEAVNRFLAVNFQFIPDPTVEAVAALPEVINVFNKMAKREKLKSLINQFKRYGLIKGDALLHVYADKFKRPGTRICIKQLKPEHYFPVEDPVTGETTGCYIVDVIPNPNNSYATNVHPGKEVVRRQTYLKIYDANGNATGQIMSDLALYEVGKWDERTLPKNEVNLVEQIRGPFFLPPEINNIPVYHWANNPPPGSTFGMSQIAGGETIVNAINQSMSDEDLTLIMQGLGVYWTDASPPLNSKGEEVEWEISPRAVVQVASGGKFDRVSGISTVQPFGDHITALDAALQQALGVPDIAVGQVDTTIAESGISLALKFGPLIAQNAEKELDLHDVLDQFLYDIVSGWIPAYEDVETEGVVLVSQFDDPMPRNKSKELADLSQLWVQCANTIPVARLYESLNDIMGWDLDPTTDFQQALDDAMRIAEAAAGPQPAPPEPNQMIGAGANSNGNGQGA